MSEVKRLALHCAGQLEEARALVEGIPEAVYAASDDESTGGVGTQLRHCLDCVVCFAQGVVTGRVDYDRRERDARTEVDPRYGADQLAEAARVLRDEVSGLDDRDLVVRMDEPGVAPDEGWQRSSAARELRFLATHTLHHFALISLMLRERGIEVDPEFGLAPATAHFRRSRSGGRA